MMRFWRMLTTIQPIRRRQFRIPESLWPRLVAGRSERRASELNSAYATVIGQEITARWVPIVWEAFRDYRKDSVILSKAETKIITLLVSGNRDAARDAAIQFGLLNRTSSGELRSNRERKELEIKLALFGLKPFWE